MGLFFPTTQAEELDPRWQRRRRRLLALTGIVALALAAAAVWHFAREQPAPRAQVAASPQDAAATDERRQRALEAGLETVTPGLPARDQPPSWLGLAQAAVEQADPWTIDWLRAWDRHDGIDATPEHMVQAVEAALMTGDTMLARWWHRRLQWHLADPGADRDAIDPVLARRVEVLDMILAGLVESALARLQQTADERPLTGQERLMLALCRRELVEGALWAGWAEDFIDLAREDHPGGALARLQLLRWLETGAAKELPRRALRATGDERLVVGAAGQETDPALREPGRELAYWLRQTWGDLADRNPDTTPAVRMALYSLDWALADGVDRMAQVVDEVEQWAGDLQPDEWPLVAGWLAKRQEWVAVRDLLGPDRQPPVPVNPRTLELYANAMGRLGLDELLAREMGGNRSRWPEPLVLLWTAHQALEGGRAEAPPLLGSMLMRAGRRAQVLEPRWMFDVAHSAFAAGLPETGAELLLLATEEPLVRERALAMLFDRSLEQGNGEDALYVVEQLRQLRPFPGPWHGMWLWLKLMEQDKSEEVLGECRLWLSQLPAERQSEARFIGAMAAARMGDADTAGRWLPQVNANHLSPRYLLFYVALVEELELDDLLAIGVEQRRYLEPVHMTRKEAAWLDEHGVLAADSRGRTPAFP